MSGFQPATELTANERWLLAKLAERGLLEEICEEAVMTFDGWIDKDEWLEAERQRRRDREAVNRWRLAEARLSGRREPSEPTATEIDFVVSMAAGFCITAVDAGMAPPMCQAVAPFDVAGTPVVCGQPAHTEKVKHREAGTGFTWWGEK
jgi:hypothetical protein